MTPDETEELIEDMGNAGRVGPVELPGAEAQQLADELAAAMQADAVRLSHDPVQPVYEPSSSASPGEPHPTEFDQELRRYLFQRDAEIVSRDALADLARLRVQREALSVGLREMARRLTGTRRAATAGIGVSGRRWEAAYRQAAAERREALTERDQLRAQRGAALALHKPEEKRVQAGSVTVCCHCGSQLWPCFTALALGVTE